MFLRLRSLRVFLDRNTDTVQIAVPISSGNGAGPGETVTVATLTSQEARRLYEALRRAVHEIDYPTKQ